MDLACNTDDVTRNTTEISLSLPYVSFYSYDTNTKTFVIQVKSFVLQAKSIRNFVCTKFICITETAVRKGVLIVVCRGLFSSFNYLYSVLNSVHTFACLDKHVVADLYSVLMQNILVNYGNEFRIECAQMFGSELKSRRRSAQWR